MKRIIFVLLFLLSLGSIRNGISAQATLFFENFETGGAGFTLNTTDLGCVGLAGYNFFTVNNAYAGGSGSLICFGFPFTFNISPTPSQPVPIQNNPTSFYLHTLSNEAVNNNIFCSSYLAADGFCFFGENYFSKMSADISTVGMSNVTLSFYWNCGGGPGSYGELYYSTNGGTNWTQQITPLAQYNNQANWTQTTIANPVFDGQAQLRFGFKFVNQTTATASDPGFSLDDFLITGIAAGLPDSIITAAINPLQYCEGDTIMVPYTVQGNFQAGNVFSAELSDPFGGFAGPTIIGNLPGTQSGVIIAIVPPGISQGTAYRIRVTASNPPVVGNDNGANITLEPASQAGSIFAAADSVCAGDSVLIYVSGYYGSLVWEYSENGQPFSTYLTGVDSFFFQPSGITGDFRVIATNAFCDGDTSLTISVTTLSDPVASFSFTDMGLTVMCTDLSVGNGPLNWLWDFGDGNTSIQQNPTHVYAQAGTYTICLTIQDVCGMDSTCMLLTGSGLHTLAKQDRFSVFPNPAKSVITLVYFTQSAGGSSQFQLFDILGAEILKKESVPSGSGQMDWDLGDLPEGMYFIRFSGENSTLTQKVFIRK